MADRIRPRRGTATEWSTVNPVLAMAEMGLETDTRKVKFGDGVSAWNDLDYGVLPSLGDLLPEGGTEGQVLSLGTDGVVWVDLPAAAEDELPEGGTEGQVLAVGAEGLEWVDFPDAPVIPVLLIDNGAEVPPETPAGTLIFEKAPAEEPEPDPDPEP